jgi:hypothetical protein
MSTEISEIIGKYRYLFVYGLAIKVSPVEQDLPQPQEVTLEEG